MLSQDNNPNSSDKTNEANTPNTTVTYDSWSFKLSAPEGTVYVFILEDKVSHKPLRIHTVVGKSGSSLMALVAALCGVMSRQLERGLMTLEDIQEELSSLTTDKKRGVITSVPEAIFVAISKYKTMKFIQYEEEIERNLGTKARIRRRDD